MTQRKKPELKKLPGYTKQDEAAGLKPTNAGGKRVARYDPTVAMSMVELVADGKTLAEICRSPGFPTRQTFHRWVAKFPDVKKAYDAARELSAHSMEESALDIAKKLTDEAKKMTSVQISAYRAAMEQLRWSASRRDPARYGQQGDKSATIVPIQINTSLDLGSGVVSTSTEEHPNIYKVQVGAKPLEVPQQVVEPQTQTKEVKPKSAPRRKKGHKTEAQIRATKAAMAKRKKKLPGGTGG